MTEREKILQVLYDFEYAGLISKNYNQVFQCVADRVLGIGIGEQGFVTSKEDMRAVMEIGMREENPFSHQLRFDRTEVLMHTDCFATVCAEVCVVSQKEGEQHVTESRFSQLLTVMKERENWRICALHASTPVVTEESAEAYPLKIAEKTLESLKKKIGEKVYAAEEQYRQAILADTIAFYVVNLTRNMVEKCQCKSDLCANLEEGGLYQEHLEDKLPQYVISQDKGLFHHNFCRDNLLRAYHAGQKEVSYEYRLKTHDGTPIWVVSVARLILDIESGDLKAILYVRNIDQKKREELELQRKATCDGMTGLHNKNSMMQAISGLLNIHAHAISAFIMLDVDNFKEINDNFGHPAGDQVLIQIARLLDSKFEKPNDIVARLGGDEFAVFIPQAESEANMMCKLGEVFEQIHCIRMEGISHLAVSCSAGLAFQDEGDDFEKIYAKADHALYCSKKNGKRQITVYCHPQH